MHGMINRGLQSFVHDYYGARKWEEACVAANLPFYSFETLVLYEDDITRRLLEALSVVLDRAKEDILEDFGTYVVTDEQLSGVRRLLKFGGDTYVDFLMSLDDLSARLKIAMPFLQVPNLMLEEKPDNVYSVHHEYTLPGYGSVLLGLLRAMADDYGALVTIEHHEELKGPVPRDRFDIKVHEERWQNPSNARGGGSLMENGTLALDSANDQNFLRFSTRILDSFLPMHIWVSRDGRILHIGPTFRKFQTSKAFVGRNLFKVLVFRHPKNLVSMDGLAAHEGSMLKAHLINGSVSGLRGNCAALPKDQGFLLNFGLGPNVHKVVNDLGLKAPDFSPSDPTAELLCMTEMQSLLLNESVRLNQQLNGAKHSAEARASRDPLTGLGNRRLLADYLQRLQARATGAQFALLHIDLDKFKQVNDALGHSAGDAVLQEVAKVLQAETRPDDVVVRLGGDEFVVVLGHIDSIEQVQALADRLIEKISAPVLFGDISCQVGASIGAVEFDGAWALDPHYVIEEADKRLYEAKEKGRGCAIVEVLPKPADHR